MKPVFANAFLIFTILCSNSHPVYAQTDVRTAPYFGLDDRAAATDTFIIEKRNGPDVISATIDFCFREEPEANWDRAVFDLKSEDGRLSGSGISEIQRKAVSFDLLRKRNNLSISYSGTIRVGSSTVYVGYDHAGDLSDNELQNPQNYISVAEDPDDFAVLSPQTVGVRFKRGELKSILNLLRGEPVVLQPENGFVEDCWVIRSGMQTLVFTAAPEKAQVLINKLRGTPGVIAAGWSGFGYHGNMVRLQKAEWFSNGKLDRDRLAGALTKSVARIVAATPLSSRWNQNTGELVVELKRPSVRFRAVGFTETLTVSLLAEPERFGATENLIVWVQPSAVTVADEGPEPRFSIAPYQEIGGEGIYLDQTEIVAGIAKDLRGSIWDADTVKWSPVQ